MTSPLDWTLPTSEIGERGRREARTATAAELVALAAELDVLACDQFVTSYDIQALGGGRFRLEGSIEGKVTQACVVTLDPVAETISERFTVELVPEANIPERSSDEEQSVLGGEDIEPIRNGVIPLGRIFFEQLSAALDPYPRKPGVEFDWQDPRAVAEKEKSGPFAALAKLKRTP